MTMNDRRRALMGAQTGINDILYQKKNWTFSGGNLVTGVKLLETDMDFSVAMDVVTTTNPSNGDGSAFRLLRIINPTGNSYSLAVYKNVSSSYDLTFRFMQATKSIGSSATGRHRFVITHTQGSDSATIKYRKDSGTAESSTINDTFTATTNVLTMGQTSGVNQLPSGTLNELTVYNRVLSASEINSFLGL